MKVAPSALSPVFRSDAQGRLLAAVFVDPLVEHSITDLAHQAGTSLQTALREIDRAEEAGLVRVRRVGNTRLVEANEDRRLYLPYRQIVLATYGPPAVLRLEFEGVRRVEAVFIFGSWAARYEGVPGREPNDIDVLVVGEPDRDEVYAAVERAETALGLPVQATIRSLAKWQHPGDDPFIQEITSRPIVPVLGDIR